MCAVHRTVLLCAVHRTSLLCAVHRTSLLCAVHRTSLLCAVHRTLLLLSHREEWNRCDMQHVWRDVKGTPHTWGEVHLEGMAYMGEY